MHHVLGTKRIGGVELRADWSWPILSLAFFVSLASALFATHPTWSIATSIGLAAIAALGLVASVIAREVLQALVASRLGSPLTGVTVFLAGSSPSYARAQRSALSASSSRSTRSLVMRSGTGMQ